MTSWCYIDKCVELVKMCESKTTNINKEQNRKYIDYDSIEFEMIYLTNFSGYVLYREDVDIWLYIYLSPLLMYII